METLFIVCLAIVWAAVLVPPMLHKRREGRPGSSVSSFRRQLSTLERATPGTSLRPMAPYQPSPIAGTAGPARMNRSQVVRRRRDVLFALAGATTFTFLLLLTVGGGFVTLLFLASAGSLSAYVYALVQLRKRAEEASAKVRVLRPPASVASMAPARRTASN